jgi:uncharacterized protein (TIGR02145 family)
MAVLTINNNFCGEVTQVKYGYLYNWYAATNALEITSSANWIVPDESDFITFILYIGGQSGTGGKIKETGLTYWNTPNTGATNEVFFNGKASGSRPGNGIFSDFGNKLSMLSLDGNNVKTSGVNHNSTFFFLGQTLLNDKAEGYAIRLVKNSTTLSDGQSGIYTGNDGKVYRTICIGTQEWLADNLAETKYRNSNIIPTETDNTTWAGLTTGAKCAYDNDLNNV